MKSTYRITILAIILAACSGAPRKQEEGWEVTIRGKVGYPQMNTPIVIRELRQDRPTTFEDTIQMKGNYTFEKKIRIKEPGYYQLNFFKRQFVTVILDKSNLEVNVDGNDPDGFYEVKGSPDQELLRQLQAYLRDAQGSEEAKALESEFQLAARNNDEAKIMELREKYQAVVDKAYDQSAAFLVQQPPSLGLINLLQNGRDLDRDKYFDVYLTSADKFRKEWPDNYYAKEFVQYVEVLKKTAIGQPAPEISLPDPSGKLVTLSSFRGKFVFVDFWAKWCGPCRKENPNLVKAYRSFKGKDFEILGVSLDRNREDWLKTIQDDGLTWTNISDLKFWNSQAARDYNLSAIPYSVLVDPQGIIVAKNLRGPALSRKLKEVLKRKS
jgi:peroxiredoxin